MVVSLAWARRLPTILHSSTASRASSRDFLSRAVEYHSGRGSRGVFVRDLNRSTGQSETAVPLAVGSPAEVGCTENVACRRRDWRLPDGFAATVKSRRAHRKYLERSASRTEPPFFSSWCDLSIRSSDFHRGNLASWSRCDGNCRSQSLRVRRRDLDVSNEIS